MEEFHKNRCPVWRKRNAEHCADKHAKLVELLVKELNALEQASRPTLLQPVKSKSMGLREIKCHLGAICFVEYERGKGVKKSKSLSGHFRPDYKVF
jgi:hypothetical protein